MAGVTSRPGSYGPAPRGAAGASLPGSSRGAALAVALEHLADASDTLTIAVERHDLAALIAASDRAERLTEQVAGLAAELEPSERSALDSKRIAGLRERLAVSARRNAYLIERAWSLDAATMRLLAGVGTDAADGGTAERPTGGYRPAPVSAIYLDREA